MCLNLKSCAAGILCGGQSRRMGYDKAFLRLPNNGGYLLEYLAAQLRQKFGQILLITDRPPKLTDMSGLAGLQVVKDIVPQAGPMAAIYTALKFSDKNNIFIMACDMPRIHWQLIQKMAMMIDGFDAVIPQYDSFLEPLYGFYSRQSLPIFKQALELGNLKIRDVFAHLRVYYQQLHPNEDRVNYFANINRPEDLSLLL